MLISLTSFSPPRLREVISMAICLTLMAGCTVGPSYSTPKNELQGSKWLSEIKANNSTTVLKATNTSKWWLSFNDPVLIELENSVQQTNLDLQMAASRIEQSRALLGITESSLQSNVAANAGYSRSGLSENGQFAALGAPTTASNFWQTSVDASWELDL